MGVMLYPLHDKLPFVFIIQKTARFVNRCDGIGDALLILIVSDETIYERNRTADTTCMVPAVSIENMLFLLMNVVEPSTF